MSVHLKDTSINGTADDCIDRVPLRALMCRLRYAGADICRILNVSMASLYRRCAAPPATNAVPSVAGVHVIVLAFDERSWRRCSVPAAACDGAGWSAVEHSVAVVDPGKDQTESPIY